MRHKKGQEVYAVRRDLFGKIIVSGMKGTILSKRQPIPGVYKILWENGDIGFNEESTFALVGEE
jgi:hypothetical protein